MQPEISRLIYRHILGTISPEEEKELRAWATEDPDNAEFMKGLVDVEYLLRERKLRGVVDTSRPERDMRRRINAMKMRRAAKIAACAAVVCGVAFGLYNMFDHTPSMQPEMQLSNSGKLDIDSIKPGRQVAALTLSEGVSVTVDSLNTAAMPPVGSAAEDGRHVSKAPEELCLDVPRGGEFKIVLSDSTVVWLNSASQLRFPETFETYERRVSISGEAYFEVRKDSVRPFLVEASGQLVRVYGTRFDVKAYPDEETVYTTLESGSVSLCRLDRKGGELFLSPGQQALFSKKDDEVSMKEVRTELITGWRHGRFVFEEQTLENIMRDLSRWYDFEYEITDPSLRDDIFLGSIPRYSDFRTAISILEKCGEIVFSTSGDKVTVSRKPHRN